MAANGALNQQQQPNIWLQGATSFDCDGCGHHASFHKMDNRQDEETERRWKSADAHSESIQSIFHMRKESLAADIARDSQLRQIDNQKAVDSDDDLRIIEDDQGIGRPARKKRRTAAR
ncbi:MAG: hypothetical protein Q9201_004375 [Fulgogasparrea decipioides]